MTSRSLALAALLGALLAVSPAWAEHKAAAPPEGQPTLEAPGTEHFMDFTLKLGPKGFRLGSRLFGPDGLTGGGWLTGETGRHGFSLDGRVEHDGKSHGFKFNADI